MARERTFGGDWTEEKLEMLRRYLEAYVTALRHQPFSLVYIDAFAGMGYRKARRPQSPVNLLFAEFREEESNRFLKGSPRIALSVSQPFDEYMFIEKDRRAVRELDKLKEDFPDLSSRIRLLPGDANKLLSDICTEGDWRSRRAVVFLDPFAMQVEWKTLEAIARTRAMDTWILWPVMAMNRGLQHAGQIPQSWRSRLDRFLGTKDWYSKFYDVKKATDLFGQDIETIQKVVNFEGIKSYLNRRLAGIFAGVADNPRLLCNSRGTALFLLCFAAANPRGMPIAKRIAEYILKE